MKQVEQKGYITVLTAVGLSKATERTVRRWISEKKFPVKRVGNRVWIEGEAFKCFLLERGVECLSGQVEF